VRSLADEGGGGGTAGAAGVRGGAGAGAAAGESSREGGSCRVASRSFGAGAGDGGPWGVCRRVSTYTATRHAATATMRIGDSIDVGRPESSEPRCLRQLFRSGGYSTRLRRTKVGTTTAKSSAQMPGRHLKILRPGIGLTGRISPSAIPDIITRPD